MLKKTTAITITLAVCLAMSSCTFKTSGKPYVEKSDRALADGMAYSVERLQTDNFICYKAEDGKVMLYPVNEKKYYPYDPENLCDVTPGEIYKITYDAQRVTGGIAGHNDRYFLTVYSCKKGSYDTLFENGLAKNGYRWYQGSTIVRPVLKGSTDFIAFRNADMSYDMYTKERGKTNYYRAKEVTYKVNVNDPKQKTIELQFNVLCQSGITDEYVIECLTQGKPYDETEFFLIDCYHPDYKNPASKNNYDSMEKFAAGNYFHHHMAVYDTNNAMTGGPKKFISFEEMSSKKPEELGLDYSLYSYIYRTWAQMRDGDFFAYGRENPYSRERAMYCDVLIFSGDFGGQASVMYDKNMKLYINDEWFDYKNHPTKRHPYVIVFIRCEFNDMFPQD